jgi:hypothetical protein
MAIITSFVPAVAEGQTGLGAAPAVHALLTSTALPACGRLAPDGWVGSYGRPTNDLSRLSCPFCLGALSQRGW